MILGYDAQQVRAAEEPLLAAAPDGTLMHRAAFGLAVVVARELRSRPGRGRVGGARVVGLVGPGNNGGDTLHALALLADRGARVLAVLAADRVHAAGLAALRRSGGRVAALTEYPGAGSPGVVWMGDAVAEAFAADVVLDGLLGIGASGAVRGPGGDLVRLLAELAAQDGAGSGRDAPLVVAVDVPSGIGVDDGALPDAGVVLTADLTVTFGAVKAGLLLPPAGPRSGRVVTVDIGLGLGGVPPVVARLEPRDVAALWPVPDGPAQKYSRGVLGVVAGTSAYPGAAVLTVSGAVLAGVGMVRYRGPETVAHAVLAARPEVVVGRGRVQAQAVGPGLDVSTDPVQAERVIEAVVRAVEDAVPTVVDAGALALLTDPQLPERLPAWVVLTPHAGELAALLTSLRAARGSGAAVTRAQVEAEPLRWARAAQEATGATVLLKGEVTIVVGAPGVQHGPGAQRGAPAPTVYAQADGPAWLATAGAGDVLTGVLGALLAGRSADVVADPSLAASLAAVAALVHGRAAHRAEPGGPVAALQVAEALPGTVAELLGLA